MKQWLGLLCLVTMTGCTTLRGDPVDLRAIAKPEPEPQAAVPPQVLPPSTSISGSGNEWRVWVPRHVGPDGATSEGHWVELPKDGPRLQITEPQVTIPRPPKVVFQKKKLAQPSTPPQYQPVPHRAGYDGAPPWMAPVLPVHPGEQDGAPSAPQPGGIR